MNIERRKSSTGKAHKPKPDHPWVRNSYESMQRRKKLNEERQKERSQP